MANEFDLGLNIASIETDLPDPVITLTGSDNLTASETAEMPLLALTAYGRSWQGERIVNIADIGIEGYGIPVSNGGNYTDSNGQQWVCDELIVNADGTGKIINRTAKELLEETFNETVIAGMNLKYVYAHNTIAKERYNGFCNCFNGNGSLQSGNNVCRFDSGITYIRADEYSVEELTAYAKENPIIVVYQLAAPTENELTSEQLTALQPLIKKYGAFTAYFVSTQNGTPTPENPVDIVSTADLHRVSVPIESIGDSGSVTVTTCGKNLYNAAAATKEAVYSTGEIVSNEYMLLSDYIPCCNISNITVSGIVDTGAVAYRIAKYDNNKSFIERLVAANVSTGAYIFDVSDCCYFRFSCENNPTISATASSVQIECGLTATEYEPYKSITASITTALPLRGIPVSSGGNYTDSNGQQWICDTLEHVYGEPAQVLKRIKKSTVSLNVPSPSVDVEFESVAVTEVGSYRYYYYGNGGTYSGNYGMKKLLLTDEYRIDTGEFVLGTEYDTNCTIYSKDVKAVYGKWNYSSNGNSLEWAQPFYSLDNKEPLPSDYISVTGILSDGAEIIYPSEAEAIMLTTKEAEFLNDLTGYKGSTSIYNENTAEMTVKLLREDFEMQYINWIKESQSFICEKTGKYKIICVGGGSSGGVGAPETAETLQAAGTTTSFGNIISAEGGGKTKATMTTLNFYEVVVGGQSGYDGINYGSTSHVMACDSSVHFSSAGGNSSVMWGTGHGYGAGGGARSYSEDLAAAGGRCGKVESTIVDLEENQVIVCTIGGGGVLKLSDENVLDYLKTYVDKETTSASGMGEKVSACVSDGSDGVIIIQYLGV